MEELLRNAYVKIGITDIDGVMRGKILHHSKFEKLKADGIGFCNVIFGWDMHDQLVEDQEVSGGHNGYMDYFLGVDLDSRRNLHHESGLPFYFVDYYGKGNAAEAVCPRSVLRRVLKKFDKFEVAPVFGVDIEWFNFHRRPRLETGELLPITEGMFGYSLTRLFENRAFFDELLSAALSCGIPVEGFHTETGPGVVEAALLKNKALRTADNLALFKQLTKQIGDKHNIIPSFMAKWNTDLPGCSAHLHFSFEGQGDNHFGFREDGTLNRFTRHFLSGILNVLPEVMPFYAPTVNSYKRYVPGSWAPVSVCWGVENRTAAIRLIPEQERNLRLEMRVPGADANPYLSIAAVLASGLYGLERELPLMIEPVQGNAYNEPGLEALPNNLKTATDRMINSETAQLMFGETFIRHFAQTRYHEFALYETAVTDWELKRYFEIA